MQEFAKSFPRKIKITDYFPKILDDVLDDCAYVDDSIQNLCMWLKTTATSEICKENCYKW